MKESSPPGGDISGCSRVVADGRRVASGAASGRAASGAPFPRFVTGDDEGSIVGLFSLPVSSGLRLRYCVTPSGHKRCGLNTDTIL